MAETKRPTSPAAEEILGGYFPVLDHGFVSLVDYMGTDEDIERAARVSYGYGTRKRSATRGLIRYLRRHAHTTPSEMVELKFHCAMPIFVARQWIRHRTACLAEGTEVYFDLPGGIERRGNQLYKVAIEDLWSRFAPSRNVTRPDEQAYPYFRRDRVQQMHLRQVDEDTLDLQHTRIVDVICNGKKPVFRVTLADGKSIEATADHRFLFSDGWSTLKQAVGLEEVNGRAVWEQGDHELYVNGLAVQERVVARLVRIENIEYVGIKQTFDLEVEGPHHNFIANGIVTHNSVNEYSGRYSLMPLLFYEPPGGSFALQSATNNQGRQADPASPEIYAGAIERWERVRSEAADAYGWLVQEDVARELARIDLPLSTYTQWYWKIDLHNLLHFLKLRVDPHAQWEIREYGRVMAGMLQRVAPLSYEAWIDYEVMGARMSGAELEVLRELLDAGDEGITATSERRSAEELKAAGLSGREVRELIAKLQPADRPDYTLDLSEMQAAEDVAARMAEAVPETSG
ncbi:MAG: FAD-dependent thymidylate synthase [Gemmatimonadota bacterium]